MHAGKYVKGRFLVHRCCGKMKYIIYPGMLYSFNLLSTAVGGLQSQVVL